MKTLNITNRDIKFFIAGVLTVIIINTIFNWKEVKRDFLDGFNGTKSEVSK
jgi:hypothetical protein